MAYAVYSFTSQYTDTGLVGFYVGTREENLAECLEIASREIADDRGRPAAAERAPAREGEPEGPRRPLDGVDLEPHEPARQVADHRHGAALARPPDRGDRRGRAGRARGARVGAAPARAPLGRRHRPGRGARSRPPSRGSIPGSSAPPQLREDLPVRAGREGRARARAGARGGRARAGRARRRRRGGRLHRAGCRRRQRPARSRRGRAVRDRHERRRSRAASTSAAANAGCPSSSRRTSRSAPC